MECGRRVCGRGRTTRLWAIETHNWLSNPEDLQANAEYIRMAGYIVHVPGKANHHNYANVNLICELAVRHKVDAVWAGRGHASENPVFPDSLHKLGIPYRLSELGM